MTRHSKAAEALIIEAESRATRQEMSTKCHQALRLLSEARSLSEFGTVGSIEIDMELDATISALQRAKWLILLADLAASPPPPRSILDPIA